jgi:hypothetical protein
MMTESALHIVAVLLAGNRRNTKKPHHHHVVAANIPTGTAGYIATPMEAKKDRPPH